LTPPAIAPEKLTVRKAIGWSIAFVMLGIGFSAVLLCVWAWLLYGNVTRGLTTLTLPGPAQAIAAGSSQLVSFAFATWLIGFRILHLGRSQLRWAKPQIGVPGLGAGLLLGGAAAAGTLLSAVLVANSHWIRDNGGLGDYVTQVAKNSMVLAPAALSEELLFRGVPLVLLAAVLGRGTALVIVAGLVFALFHIVNPGITPLGMGNIALAGIFLGVAFYAPGGLWTAFGAHLGWNAMLAALDAPVSGLPFSIPYIDYRAGEPVWLSGGGFGPEGGLLATAAITAALLFTLRWIRRDPT
jgi:membrane protease YdiL (CAAX protease family)